MDNLRVALLKYLCYTCLWVTEIRQQGPGSAARKTIHPAGKDLFLCSWSDMTHIRSRLGSNLS